MGIKRYNMAYDYNPVDPAGCTCDIEESKDGYYVEFKDYMTLLAEYEEETRRARLKPQEFDLHDVTQRTQLQSQMNKHMSWIISLCYHIDAKSAQEKVVQLRSYFASRIDQQARR